MKRIDALRVVLEKLQNIKQELDEVRRLLYSTKLVRETGDLLTDVSAELGNVIARIEGKLNEYSFLTEEVEV